MRGDVKRCLEGMRLLVLSPIGAYEGFNTSIHRVRALEQLGGKLEVIDSMIPDGIATQLVDRVAYALFQRGVNLAMPDLGHSNRRLLAAATRARWDLIWLEKALTITAATLTRVRRACPDSPIVGFSPDDMNARHNQSKQFLAALPHYDCFITTKTFGVRELRDLGCPRVLHIDNGYDELAFRPIAVSREDIARLGGEIGFIGTYEESRATALLQLAARGFQVRVWGNGWDRMRARHRNLRLELRALLGTDYAMACSAFKINLCFLRKLNRDLQTTRSVEIPACGAFMLAERTAEHASMFVEGEEAEFFSDTEELERKCARYLADDAARTEIARRGRERCLHSGYSNVERLSAVLGELLENTAGHRSKRS